MKMNNEKEKLSQNRKGRIERRIKIDDKMKPKVNEIKTEKKKKQKNYDRIKESEIEMVKFKYFKYPNLLESKLKELNKIQVVDKNLHDVKNETLRDYGGEFEMIGNLSVDQIRTTHFRFRNINDYESFINAIDVGYDAEYAVFNHFFKKSIHHNLF